MYINVHTLNDVTCNSTCYIMYGANSVPHTPNIIII